MATAFAIARPGSVVARSAPRTNVVVPIDTVIFRNVGCAVVSPGSPVPAPSSSSSVLAGAINPGRIFDFETDLEHVVDGYRAMDERRAVKAMVRVGAVRLMAERTWLITGAAAASDATSPSSSSSAVTASSETVRDTARSPTSSTGILRHSAPRCST